MNTLREPERALYGDGESGWVVDLGNGTAIIMNNGDEFRCLDIVELKPGPEGEIPRVGKLIYRKYARKALIRYWDDNGFYKFCNIIRIVGGIPEGLTGPIPPHPENSKPHPGFIAVVCDDCIDPVKIAEGIGIPQTNTWPDGLVLE